MFWLYHRKCRVSRAAEPSYCGLCTKKRRKYFLISYFTKHSLHCVIQVLWMCLSFWAQSLMFSKQVFLKVWRTGQGFSPLAWLPLDHSLSCGTVLCGNRGHSAASLVSTHQTPAVPTCLQKLPKIPWRTKSCHVENPWDRSPVLITQVIFTFGPSHFYSYMYYFICFINFLICFAYSDRDHTYTFKSPTATSNSFCLEG